MLFSLIRTGCLFSGTDHIFQIDATTGASTGPNVEQSVYVYSGSLEISPDRNTLYYGQYGLSSIDDV